MKKAVRWGILGASKFAREHMAPAIHQAPWAEFVALATSDPGKAEPFRALAPGLRVHGSYEALLADAGVDAVYLPLPNHLHVEWTLKALAAGKAALTEKPMTLHESEFDLLIEARDRARVLASEAYMIVHHPQWQRARTLIADGAIGRLVQITAAFSYDNRADPANIRNRAETGGGALRDIGVYPIGGARFVTGGELGSVRARIVRENGVDVVTELSGALGEATFAAYVSMRMFPRQEMVFHGDGGVLRLPVPFNAGVFGQAELVLERPGMTIVTERFPSVNQYVLQVEAFGRSMHEGTPWPIPLEWSRGTQAAIDAAFASAESDTRRLQ